MKLVIADDNQDILETTKMALELEGHEVETVARSDAIMKTCMDAKADVLFQDASMPNLDLLAHLDAIAAEPALESLAIVMFSGQEPDAPVLDHDRVVGFLAKPFEFAELRAVLAAVSA